ncbi:ATP-binding cassette domain-containing protein, partial [Saccharothrix sp. MB29]|nr:ATP-binding cassette domain-containing protein [Saccharothrix sp. MB29]
GLALLGEHGPGVEVVGRVSVRGRVAFVPQQPSAALNPVRRLGAVFREIAALHAGDRDELVATALRRARVPAELLRRYPHQLSGGQQQRVVLAQALVGDPAVLVADEPTTGQDALTRAEVVDELAGVVAQGVALVLLTHDLAVVRALADEIVVLREGRVVEAGPAARLLTAPREEYTRALLDTVPRTAPDVPDRAPRLRVRGLTAGHRGATALHGVDLDVGERLAVVGRSGSGKTTLGRCLAGLHELAAGDVLHGRPLAPVAALPVPGRSAAVQYVFQDARACLTSTARSSTRSRAPVRLRGATPTLRGLPRRRARPGGVSPATASRRPGGLSGGELQRAALVRALLAEPDVLVCDEITSGLDAVTRGALLDLLAGVPCALVLISHDLDVVARLADRVVVLHGGRVVAHGPAAAVLEGAEERMK